MTPSAGTSYTVDHSKPVGQRVSDIVIGGEEFDPTESYKIAMNAYTLGGGDAHEVLKNAEGERYDTGLLDIDALVDYLMANTPLTRGPAGRVTLK